MPAESSTPTESSTTEETIEMSTTEEPATTTNFDEELERYFLKCTKTLFKRPICFNYLCWILIANDANEI